MGMEVNGSLLILGLVPAQALVILCPVHNASSCWGQVSSSQMVLAKIFTSALADEAMGIGPAYSLLLHACQHQMCLGGRR